MNIVIQKFGGSSVATNEKLFKVCSHIKKEYELKNKLVVIVSAQGKTTDKLIEEAKEITENPNKRELDTLISVGEQITIAKLVMCLENVRNKSNFFNRLANTNNNNKHTLRC